MLPRKVRKLHSHIKIKKCWWDTRGGWSRRREEAEVGGQGLSWRGSFRSGVTLSRWVICQKTMEGVREEVILSLECWERALMASALLRYSWNRYRSWLCTGPQSFDSFQRIFRSHSASHSTVRLEVNNRPGQKPLCKLHLKSVRAAASEEGARKSGDFFFFFLFYCTHLFAKKIKLKILSIHLSFLSEAKWCMRQRARRCLLCPSLWPFWKSVFVILFLKKQKNSLSGNWKIHAG